MANIRFGFRNIFDTATLTASPALITTLPEANLQKQERFKTARSTSLASQELRASWATAQRLNYVHLRMHNLTAAAQLAHPTYSDSAFTTLIAANAAANCFDYSGFARNDVLTEADFRLLKNSTRYLTLATTVQSAKVTIADAANPDGYFDASRIFGGEYFEMAYQLPYGGAVLTFDDFGTQDAAHDGSVISDKGAKGRRLELSQDFCQAADWAELLAGSRYAGKDKDIFVSIYPGDGTYLEPYHQGLFKFAAPSGFDRHMYGIAQTKLTLIES